MREVQHLSRQVSKMVHDALDAFARMDVAAAMKVARQGQEGDREYEALLRQCFTFLMEDPPTIRRVLDIIWCVRSLDRIGEHAPNIVEYVVYLVEEHGRAN